MAFNFNWSPLAADTDFYNRAKDLLTRALNKSPKPPIIVDDIIVADFNLGSVPPDLEILEIGDLAEDRFRGIFKMCYSGDASVTLKTRVQVRGSLSGSDILQLGEFSNPVFLCFAMETAMEAFHRPYLSRCITSPRPMDITRLQQEVEFERDTLDALLFRFLCSGAFRSYPFTPLSKPRFRMNFQIITRARALRDLGLVAP